MVSSRYRVSGIHCNSCRATIKDSVSQLPELSSVRVEDDLLLVESTSDVSIDQLSKLLPNKFSLTELNQTAPVETEESLTTYKPLIIITLYILVVTLVGEWFSSGGFNLADWMRYFMAGFFIVFSFFKLLDLSGFSKSYAMYDIVAGMWPLWGKIYPFVELALGLLFLTGWFVFELNIATLILLSIGTIGVVQSNRQKRKIKCACLGTVFNLPMTKVTIIENTVMIAMAVIAILAKLLS